MTVHTSDIGGNVRINNGGRARIESTPIAPISMTVSAYPRQKICWS